MALDDYWQVQIALTTAPFATPSWTTITSQVRSIRLLKQRGGPNEPVKPTVAEIVVDNRDGRWSGSSTYSSSPYAGNVVPDRRVRLLSRASTGDSFGSRAELFLEDVQDNLGVHDSTATLRCSGLFRILAQSQPVDIFRPVEMMGARIGALLTAAGIPSSLRGTIDAGTVTLSSGRLSGQVLALLYEINRAERGFMRETNSGTFEARDRYHWIDESTLNTSQLTIDEQYILQRQIPHRNSAFDHYRAVAASGDNGVALEYASTYAGADFPDTVHQELGLPALYDGDAEVVAEVTQKRSEVTDLDQSNPTEIELLLATAQDVNSWQLTNTFDLDVLQIVQVDYRPLGWTADRQALCRIETLEHTVTPNAWTLRLGFSPANDRWRDDENEGYFYKYGDTITADHRGSL